MARVACYRVSKGVSDLVCLVFSLFVSRDAEVYLDQVHLGSDAVGGVLLCRCNDPPHCSLPHALVQVCHSSNCSLGVANDCHRLHCMDLQCFLLVNRHIKRKSNRPQLGITDLNAPSVQKPAVGPPFISMVSRRCGFHSAIV